MRDSISSAAARACPVFGLNLRGRTFWQSLAPSALYAARVHCMEGGARALKAAYGLRRAVARQPENPPHVRRQSDLRGRASVGLVWSPERLGRRSVVVRQRRCPWFGRSSQAQQQRLPMSECAGRHQPGVRHLPRATSTPDSRPGRVVLGRSNSRSPNRYSPKTCYSTSTARAPRGRPAVWDTAAGRPLPQRISVRYWGFLCGRTAARFAQPGPAGRAYGPCSSRRAHSAPPRTGCVRAAPCFGRCRRSPAPQ